MSTSRYIYMLVFHNWTILFFRFQFEFFKLFDTFERWHYVYIKKGSSLDYHVSKIVDSMDGDDIRKFVVVRFLLERLFRNQQKQIDTYAPLFMAGFLNKFTVDRTYLDWIDRLSKIENVAGVFSFMFYIKITSERQLKHVLGEALYERLQYATFKEADKIIHSLNKGKS